MDEYEVEPGLLGEPGATSRPANPDHRYDAPETASIADMLAEMATTAEPGPLAERIRARLAELGCTCEQRADGDTTAVTLLIDPDCPVHHPEPVDVSKPVAASRDRYAARRRHRRPGPKDVLQAMLRSNGYDEHGPQVTLPVSVEVLDLPQLLPGDTPWMPRPGGFTLSRPMTFDLQGQPVDTSDERVWVQQVLAIERGRMVPGLGRIGLTYLYRRHGWLRVSTVFIGVDMGYGESGPPLLWETMIFDNRGEDRTVARYASRNAAYRGHALIVHAIRTGWAAQRAPRRMPPVSRGGYRKPSVRRRRRHGTF